MTRYKTDLVEGVCFVCREAAKHKWIKAVLTRDLQARLDKYAITLYAYEAMMTAQQGRCAICKLKKDETLHIDHCHEAGHVRGLLCRSCNTGLGNFYDRHEFLESAAEYVRQRKGIKYPS